MSGDEVELAKRELVSSEAYDESSDSDSDDAYAGSSSSSGSGSGSGSGSSNGSGSSSVSVSGRQVTYSGVDRVLADRVVDVGKLAIGMFTRGEGRVRRFGWLVLAGVLPAWHGSRQRSLAQTHTAYLYSLEESRLALDSGTLAALATDARRTLPGTGLFEDAASGAGGILATSLHRLLRVAVHGIGAGVYVQGLSDVVGCLLLFLLEGLSRCVSLGPSEWEPMARLAAALPDEVLHATEAEGFALLTALLTSPGLDGLYLPGQPRVFELIDALEYRVELELPELHAALARLDIAPSLYAYRWIATLFAREFPPHLLAIVWDGLFAYLATQPTAVGAYLVALCIETLRVVGSPILDPALPFDDAIALLHNLPFCTWSPAQVLRFTARAAAAESIRRTECGAVDDGPDDGLEQ